MAKPETPELFNGARSAVISVFVPVGGGPEGPSSAVSDPGDPVSAAGAAASIVLSASADDSVSPHPVATKVRRTRRMDQADRRVGDVGISGVAPVFDHVGDDGLPIRCAMTGRETSDARGAPWSQSPARIDFGEVVPMRFVAGVLV